MACGIQLSIEDGTLASVAWSLNHWPPGNSLLSFLIAVLRVLVISFLDGIYPESASACADFSRSSPCVMLRAGPSPGWYVSPGRPPDAHHHLTLFSRWSRPPAPLSTHSRHVRFSWELSWLILWLVCGFCSLVVVQVRQGCGDELHVLAGNPISRGGGPKAPPTSLEEKGPDTK